MKTALQEAENTLSSEEKIVSKQRSLSASNSDIDISIMTLVQRASHQKQETVDPLIENLTEVCRLLTDLQYRESQVKKI